MVGVPLLAWFLSEADLFDNDYAICIPISHALKWELYLYSNNGIPSANTLTQFPVIRAAKDN